MKQIFSRGPSLELRVIIAVIIAILLAVFDHEFDTFKKIRGYIETSLSPFYFFINIPKKILDNISDVLVNRDRLLFENKVLKKEILLKRADNLLLEQLKQENSRLRELLSSPVRQYEHITVTQVLSGFNTPYRKQIIIDKGLLDGVYQGQPVINDKGIIGQVITVSIFNSRVLLICDKTHALPIQVLRNDIRVIAMGTGCIDHLQLEPLPDNVDIRIGDIIVTSGLGGRFPEGYPVGIVSFIKRDIQRAHTIVHARPTANLQRLRYLLLLWNDDKNNSHTLEPSKVYRTANERLMKIKPNIINGKN